MKSKAFTLIELLIVVAIIAILAAIAIPNFLEAQTRAKISRGKADMRSIATALETYAVDNSKYPYDIDSRGWPYYLTDIMTTPIAYITGQRNLIDQFRLSQTNVDLKRLRYLNYTSHRAPGWLPCPFPGPFRTRWFATQPDTTIADGMRINGTWKLSSAGPDTTVNKGFFLDELYYDATNGTVSGGDIVLSQKGMK